VKGLKPFVLRSVKLNLQHILSRFSFSQLTRDLAETAATSSTLEVKDSYPTLKGVVLILLSLALETFLFAIDTTIIAVAVPRISSESRALN